MKRISTLFAFVSLFVMANTASAQYSQNFDNAAEGAALQSNCWKFKDFTYSSAGLNSSAGSLTTPLSDSAFFTTPLMNKPESGELNVSLTYLVSSVKAGINVLKINVIDLTGKAISVGKINIGTADGTNPISVTLPPKQLPAMFYIQVVALNVAVTIDDLSTNATLTPDGCTGTILTPAPVKLMSFAGNVNANKAQLKWSVADNETGDKFQVLRSTDGKNFAEISTVFISNKAGAESYTFADPKELDAITYYRLKIINKDGSVAFSNIISLKSATEKPNTGITILKNPVESTLTFTYSANTTSQGQVSIYNTVGVKVYSSRLQSQKGINAVSLNLDSHMAAGTYILEVVNGTERAVTRMIKQ